MRSRELQVILRRILSRPTAPLREEEVAREVETFAREEGSEAVRDPFGNRIVVYRPAGRARRGRLGFVAHMDHPGFEIAASKGRRAAAVWRGGVGREYFDGARILVHHDGGVRGRVVKVRKLDAAKRRVEWIDLLLERPVPAGAFGQWDLVPFEMRGELVATRAADDLCSVAIQLALLRELKRAGIRHEIWLVFTRAEEIGFCGIMAMLRKGLLPSDIPFISVEPSRMLPGAVQGEGPVIRLGDRATIYSSNVVLYMEQCATAIRKRTPRFRFQRRVMDGGTSESSPFVCYGYETAGIAFPLGNYHNMGDRKGKGKRAVLRAETVHLRDLMNGLSLMVEMSRRLPDLPTATTRLKKTIGVRSQHLTLK